jgi:Holliday junction resolvase
MSYLKRVDKNQSEIVDVARKLGYYVHHTHEVGKGFPDLVAGKKGINFLMEIKNGNSSLTLQQKEFHKNFLGTVTIIRSIDDLIKLDKKLFGN